jgi:hypothetical protein
VYRIMADSGRGRNYEDESMPITTIIFTHLPK